MRRSLKLRMGAGTHRLSGEPSEYAANDFLRSQATTGVLMGFDNVGLVDQNIASWNQIALWLRQLQELRSAA
jgi:hypothetical protein